MIDKFYDEWFLYYRDCEKKLKKINEIVKSKNFNEYYKKNEDSELWQDVCGIFALSDIQNPEEYKEYLEKSLKQNHEERNDTSKQTKR